MIIRLWIRKLKCLFKIGLAQFCEANKKEEIQLVIKTNFEATRERETGRENLWVREPRKVHKREREREREREKDRMHVIVRDFRECFMNSNCVWVLKERESIWVRERRERAYELEREHMSKRESIWVRERAYECVWERERRRENEWVREPRKVHEREREKSYQGIIWERKNWITLFYA